MREAEETRTKRLQWQHASNAALESLRRRRFQGASYQFQDIERRFGMNRQAMNRLEGWPLVTVEMSILPVMKIGIYTLAEIRSHTYILLSDGRFLEQAYIRMIHGLHSSTAQNAPQEVKLVDIITVSDAIAQAIFVALERLVVT
jgi:hypothetical protein